MSQKRPIRFAITGGGVAGNANRTLSSSFGALSNCLAVN
jgi:hypothetical protein